VDGRGPSSCSEARKRGKWSWRESPGSPPAPRVFFLCERRRGKVTGPPDPQPTRESGPATDRPRPPVRAVVEVVQQQVRTRTRGPRERRGKAGACRPGRRTGGPRGRCPPAFRRFSGAGKARSSLRAPSSPVCRMSSFVRGRRNHLDPRTPRPCRRGSDRTERTRDGPARRRVELAAHTFDGQCWTRLWIIRPLFVRGTSRTPEPPHFFVALLRTPPCRPGNRRARPGQMCRHYPVRPPTVVSFHRDHP